MTLVRNCRCPSFKTCNSTVIPASGLPQAVSSPCVESVAILPPQPQTETSIRRSRFGVHRDILTIDDHVPSPIIRFQVDFGDRRRLLQDSLTRLIDDLLNASGFETAENLMHNSAHL